MRLLQGFIQKDLQDKFVLLAGPRQVGKTHLAQAIQDQLGGQYFNWDASEDRTQILDKAFVNESFVVLDEIHKYHRWKNYLKGIYDKHHKTLKVLVTGSARLDIYQRGGDSLLGRHYLHHLHPFSVAEIMNPRKLNEPNKFLEMELTVKPQQKETVEHLLRFSGFPEPFLKASEEAYTRWNEQRRQLLIQQDLRDLTEIQLISLVEHLMLLLSVRAGGILSITSLKEELQVAYNTVKQWLDVFSRLYISYLISPYTKKVTRAVKKEKKLYLWNWADVKDSGARFENFIASHLLKTIQTWNDLGKGRFGLYYVRDRDRREVDFLITKDDSPWFLSEVKLSETQVSETLIYFAEKFNCTGFQIIQKPGFYKKQGRIIITDCGPWLENLV